MTSPRSRRQPGDQPPEEPVEPPVGAEESPTTGEAAPPEPEPTAEPEPPAEPEAAVPEPEPPAEPAPEGVLATEPAGPCRMCSEPIDAGQQYMVINIGRRVHYGDCADQARAAGYLEPIEA